MIVIGHRGASGHEPENTLESFRKALDLNVDMIELDVYNCRSGELVVFHDDSLRRITGHFGKVEKKTFEELRKLDAGRGEKIPALEEVLELVDRRAKVNIELKGAGTAGPAYDLMEKFVNERGWSRDDFIISSFNHSLLEEFCKTSSEYRIGILSSKKRFDYIDTASRLSAFSAHPELKNVTPELVDSLHKHGLAVYVWVVNEPKDIKMMQDYGVDGIFTDFPDRALNALL